MDLLQTAATAPRVEPSSGVVRVNASSFHCFTSYAMVLQRKNGKYRCENLKWHTKTATALRGADAHGPQMCQFHPRSLLIVWLVRETTSVEKRVNFANEVKEFGRKMVSKDSDCIVKTIILLETTIASSQQLIILINRISVVQPLHWEVFLDKRCRAVHLCFMGIWPRFSGIFIQASWTIRSQRMVQIALDLCMLLVYLSRPRFDTF